MKRCYIHHLLIALDQLANALLAGYADETLSSRMYRYELKEKQLGKIMRPIIDTLFFFDKNHCFNSYLSELDRRHLPREFQP
jgi:hypothetical protein